MIEPLHTKHHKADFDCGNEQLNHYLKAQASQDMKRKLSACFVYTENESNHIKGYYTLSTNSIPVSSFSAQIQKKLPPSYHSIPTTLLGRLAIDQMHQGKGLGKILLIDALKRSYENAQEIGSFAVVVDPIDDAAKLFYEKYDFITLPDAAKMFITTKTLAQLFA